MRKTLACSNRMGHCYGEKEIRRGKNRLKSKPHAGKAQAKLHSRDYKKLLRIKVVSGKDKANVDKDGIFLQMPDFKV
ncbi:MAG: hypothetical protein H6565_17565 [Lewinellaceae bacterium]|nr:hypothetical protein [Saprospiraceae bacterium]MCB9308406.1 hypothetical protein [Lewinellaceae bacterium]MCB9356659.1 hypothetical protein [Lewinellaceae bacterium]